MTWPRFTVGVDLGQRNDWTAIAVVERVYNIPPLFPRDGPVNIGPTLPSAPLHLRALDRVPLGTPYPAIVDRVAGLLGRVSRIGDAHLVVDATGVGRPVVDLLRASVQRVIAVTITSGASPTQNRVRGGEDWTVPKRDLVSMLEVLLGNGRLKFARALPHVQTLVDELLTFEARITAAAHDTYNARAGAHDDLVLAAALACWWAERKPPARVTFGAQNLMAR